MTKTIGRLELVYWNDAVTHHGWEIPADNYEPGNCVSVGWIMQDDKRVLVVAPNRYEDYIAEPTVIPKGWVTKRIVLRRR